MAKSMKTAATEGASVLDTITNGAQYVKNAQDAKDVKGAKDTKSAQGRKSAKNVKDTKDARDKQPGERLNLKIPADIKEYLIMAASRESIAQRKRVSLTDYLCDLVRADMKKHKDK